MWPHLGGGGCMAECVEVSVALLWVTRAHRVEGVGLDRKRDGVCVSHLLVKT